MNINEESKYYVSMFVPQDQENGKGQIGRLTRSLWLNVPKVTAYPYFFDSPVPLLQRGGSLPYTQALNPYHRD